MTNTVNHVNPVLKHFGHVFDLNTPEGILTVSGPIINGTWFVDCNSWLYTENFLSQSDDQLMNRYSPYTSAKEIVRWLEQQLHIARVPDGYVVPEDSVINTEEYPFPMSLVMGARGVTTRNSVGPKTVPNQMQSYEEWRIYRNDVDRWSRPDWFNGCQWQATHHDVELTVKKVYGTLVDLTLSETESGKIISKVRIDPAMQEWPIMVVSNRDEVRFEDVREYQPAALEATTEEDYI